MTLSRRSAFKRGRRGGIVGEGVWRSGARGRCASNNVAPFEVLGEARERERRLLWDLGFPAVEDPHNLALSPPPPSPPWNPVDFNGFDEWFGL